jgi:uncharacterized protein (TIGR02466 family)
MPAYLDYETLEATMPVKPWFPTFVYESSLERRAGDFARTLLEDCHSVREHDTAGQEWCRVNYPAGYSSYGTLRNLHRTLPRFIELRKKIWKHVERFAGQIDMDLREAQLAMTDCWINIMSRDAVHPWHVHPGAVFSGTFYVSTPSGCSGLSFEDPRIEHFGLTPPRLTECRPANRQRISYEVEPGKLILFESWLRHEVAANPTQEERVSISFNYTWV